MSFQNIHYIDLPAKSKLKIGLHANCSGCGHILNQACIYVTHPRHRKWPCYFRTYVEVKSASSTLLTM